MKKTRGICIILILVFYACGTVPCLMGWYNRPGTLWGIPVFILGILALAFLMLFTLLFLYLYEEKREGGREK